MKREIISFSKHNILTNAGGFRAFPVKQILISFGKDFSVIKECLAFYQERIK